MAMPPRRRCKYGADCYRVNPVHLAEFAHPGDPDWEPKSDALLPLCAPARIPTPVRSLASASCKKLVEESQEADSDVKEVSEAEENDEDEAEEDEGEDEEEEEDDDESVGSEESWEDEEWDDSSLEAAYLSRQNPKKEAWLKKNRHRFIYLEVSFNDKDEAQKSGARFDGKVKKWYIKPGQKLVHFSKWLPGGAKGIVQRAELSATAAVKEVGGVASEQTYLNCSFADKEEVKALGARFDGMVKKWYVTAGMKLAPFTNWLPQQSDDVALAEPPAKKARADGASASVAGTSKIASVKTFLKCPYSQKDEAKSLGAKWDVTSKSWFIEQGTPLAPFTRWLN